MNVRTLCLAILHFEDATGYEIKKASAEGKYSYFVDVSFGSIYPALAKLEAEGCVTVRHEITAGKPARKVYSITDAGNAELRAALSETPGRDVFRSEFLLVAMLCDGLPQENIRTMIDERIAAKRAELKQLKDARATISLTGAQWTLSYGIACTSAALAYLESSRDELEAFAGTALENTERNAAQ